MLEQLGIFLERFAPTTRLLIVALVPAFLVFIIEEATRSSPAPVEIERPVEAPIKHTFTKKDVDSITGLATRSGNLLKSLDEEMSRAHANPNTAICLNGLRYGVYNYINTILLHVQQDMVDSVHMQKAEDEAYVDTDAFDLVGSTIQVLPAMDNTITVMTRGCPGDGAVANWGVQMKTLLNTMTPTFRALYTRAPKL